MDIQHRICTFCNVMFCLLISEKMRINKAQETIKCEVVTVFTELTFSVCVESKKYELFIIQCLIVYVEEHKRHSIFVLEKIGGRRRIMYVICKVIKVG